MKRKNKNNLNIINWLSGGFIVACFISLAGCLLALLAENDQLAKEWSAHIYYFLVGLFLVKFLDFKKNYQKLESANRLTNNDQVKLKSIRTHKSKNNKWEIKVYNILVTFINLVIIVIYLLIFGTNLPTSVNYWQFILLGGSLLLANSILFFDISPNRRDHFWVRTKSWFQKRNNISVIIINLSLFLIYFLIFGFDFPTHENLIKYLVFIFILLVANVIAIFDLSNEESTR